MGQARWLWIGECGALLVVSGACTSTPPPDNTPVCTAGAGLTCPKDSSVASCTATSMCSGTPQMGQSCMTTVDATTGAQSFNYAFEDVGIVLTVTPHITSNGYVTMDVDQSANDLQGYTSFNAPIVNQRTASTTVSVKTGETIVLGGIIRNQVTSTVNKIPILGDIPILGQLFRSTTKDNQKTELMVFLTPQVIRNDDDAKGLKDSTIKGMTPDAQKTLKNAIPPSTGDAHKSPPPGP